MPLSGLPNSTVQRTYPQPQITLCNARREDTLPGAKGRECRIFRQQPVQEGRTAAWHAQYEYRLTDVDLPVVSKQDLVNEETDPVKQLQDQQYGKEDAECGESSQVPPGAREWDGNKCLPQETCGPYARSQDHVAVPKYTKMPPRLGGTAV